MKARLNTFATAPDTMQAMLALQGQVDATGLEESLLELVKTRASQINGCAFCLHMHTRDARARGETEMRLYLLSAWRESPLYTARERAALAWTEALIRINNGPVEDGVHHALAAQFTAEEQVKLTLAIVTINGWNMFNVGFRTPHPVP